MADKDKNKEKQSVETTISKFNKDSFREKYIRNSVFGLIFILEIVLDPK